MKDPICGMELKESETRHRVDFKDKTYYFCSLSCRELFEKLNGLKSDELSEVKANERKMIAYNTLKQLTATIAHYIGNANAAISAQAQINDLPIVKKESAKIDAVVKALLAMSDIRLQKYVENEEEAIFDLRNSIAEILPPSPQ